MIKSCPSRTSFFHLFRLDVSSLAEIRQKNKTSTNTSRTPTLKNNGIKQNKKTKKRGEKNKNKNEKNKIIFQKSSVGVSKNLKESQKI